MDETKEIIAPTANIEQTEKYQFPFTLGADPEFTVMSGTRPMNAENIFQALFKDMEKGDHGFKVKGGNIGWDNHPATGELRPDPGSPEEVTENLKSMFEEAHKRMPFVDLTTLTVAAAAGGHIHLSIPEELNQDIQNETKKWDAIKRAVGMFTMLIHMGENDLSRGLRKSFQQGQYGGVLDFRCEPKFEHKSGQPGYTIEVRGPTAEWITSEKIALGTLAYMAIAWDSILKDNLKPLSTIMLENKTKAKEVELTLTKNYGNIQKVYLDKMKPFIRSHPAYKQFKPELELILNPTRVKEEKKKVHYCINEGWGFTSTSKAISFTKFMNEAVINEATSKFPEKAIRNMSQFAWNEDINVEQFATALSKRCVALGWKPQHEYYLFGLRKGIDEIILTNEKGEILTGEKIIQTKEDYKLIQSKFGKLGKKAIPIYGNIINSKTGEIAGIDEGRRVMIGIPYEMRQKNDIKPLIRLVLRYEKSPKTYKPIDLKTLPSGESKLKLSMANNEEQEKGIDEAMRRGESPMFVPQDLVDAAIEQIRQDQPENQNISLISRQLIMSRMSTLNDIWSDYSRTIEGAIQMLDETIGNRREFPRINNESLRRIVKDELMQMLHEWDNGEDDDEVIAIGEHANAYLITSGMAQRGSSSIDINENIIHLIRFRQSQAEQRGTGSFEMLSRNKAQEEGRSQSIEPILDLLGVKLTNARADIERMLRNDQGQWYEAKHRSTVAITPNADGIMEEQPEIVLNQTNKTIIINPDEQMPHVWKH